VRKKDWAKGIVFELYAVLSMSMTTYVTFYRKYYPNGDSRIWTGPYIHAKNKMDLDYMVKRLSKFFPNLQVAGALVGTESSLELNKNLFN